jgi:hypothetical protein
MGSYDLACIQAMILGITTTPSSADLRLLYAIAHADSLLARHRSKRIKLRDEYRATSAAYLKRLQARLNKPRAAS